jgi:hypothetical protein
VLQEGERVADETVAPGIIVSWVVPAQPGLVAGGTALPETVIVARISAGPEAREVPDVVGLNAEEATAQLDALGLVVEQLEDEFSDEVPVGAIARQNPPGGAGLKVAKGSTVQIAVSKGQDLVVVPPLGGLTVAEVTTALTDAGLTLGEVKGDPAGMAVLAELDGMSLAAGVTLPRGTPVDVTFEVPPPPTTIPPRRRCHPPPRRLLRLRLLRRRPSSVRIHAPDVGASRTGVRMGSLDGRVAIITGAGRGIGREHALFFAAEGAKVVVNDLGATNDGTGADISPAQSVVEEIEAMGGEAIVNGENVADWQGAQRMINSAIEAFGDLDILVNNAGILRDRVLVNMTEEEWDVVIAVHLKGHFAPAAGPRRTGASSTRPASRSRATSSTRRRRPGSSRTRARRTTARRRRASRRSARSSRRSSRATT